MKAGLACALSVFIETARSVKRGEITLQYPLVFIGTVDEEGDMQGVEQVLRDGWVMKEDWVLDTEPTFGEIQVAHKGRTWFQIEMQGVTAHASMPQTGADAIAAMSYVVTYLRERFLTYPIHEEMGPSTITFGQIQGGYAPYVVPDLARLTIDMRLTPPVTTQVVTELVEEAIAYAKQKVQGVTGSYRITGDRPSIERDSNSFLLHQLSDAVQSVTGQDVKVRVFPGYTDTAVIAGKLQNHNCMSYGPGSLEQAHKPNEYVATTEIDRCQEIFRVLVRKMLTYERAL
jgi:succinyl-diaminopimelate desuccinylase